MHGILNNGIQYLVQLIGMYEGSTHYIIAWAVSMVLLAFCGGRKGRAVFIWPALILLVTVFNPFFIGILFKGEEGQLNGFLPYLWMLPVLIVIPAGAGALASKLPFSVLKVLPFIAVIAFAAYFGVPRPSAYLKLTLPENYHKADTELLTICSYLEVHKKKSGYSAAFEDAGMQDECAEYTARIVTSDLFRTDRDLSRPAELKKALKDEKPDYIVCAKDGKMPDVLDDSGWKAIACTDHYLIYRSL